MNTAAPENILHRARELVSENRPADAALLLEKQSFGAADCLHLEIALRCATAALQNREIAVATAWLDRGLSRNPSDAALNFFRGNLHLDSGHPSAAVACLQCCVAKDPTREEYVCNLGYAQLQAGRPREALATLAALPRSAMAQLNAGAALEQLGEYPQAAIAYDTAARLQPDKYEAWFNLGGIRARLGDANGALSAYNRALALRPTEGQTHLERGHLLSETGNLTDAIRSFERAVKFESSRIAARIALVHTRLKICDWQDLPNLRQDLVEPLLRALDHGRSFKVFEVLALPGVVTPEEMRRFAEAAAAREHTQVRQLRPTASRIAGRRLRIGYVSPDFGNHAVANCLRAVVAAHDRQQVEIHAFSLVNHPPGECLAGLRASCDTWTDLSVLGNAAAAERIASREIDVLVDLAGFTQHHRLGLFAWRPAPVQVSWLGFPGTTGAPFIDALIADAIVIPPDCSGAFSEKIVRLPGCYLPGDRTVQPAAGCDSRAENGLPEAGFVFCAFNNTYKIEPYIFGAWMQILKRTPGSVLWLRKSGTEAEANLRREAESRGVAGARLVFENRGLPMPEHLARHRAAGLFLDTHFYNAHSTAAVALRAGLPVLTFPGQSFPSRVAHSLITALGLADSLVANSLNDYVERAVRLASEPDSLAELRDRLALAVEQPGGAFDPTAFARKLEVAFQQLAKGA